MAKQPYISHAVNGYSRYDVPENKAFSCTPGILYPVRIDYINARDRVTISQGIDVRSNPLAVPTFNPYTVRLHRFFVPLQLYHPEMRTNSSQFDMNNLSLNWLFYNVGYSIKDDINQFYQNIPLHNSLLSWLRAGNHETYSVASTPGVSLPESYPDTAWINSDTLLAYWDIVRNYYAYSQWSLYSFAWPGSWFISCSFGEQGFVDYKFSKTAGAVQGIFTQRFGNLQFLDAYFESQFYPGALSSDNNTFNRGNLFFQIINSDLLYPEQTSSFASQMDGFPVSDKYDFLNSQSLYPTSEFNLSSEFGEVHMADYIPTAFPMAVVPSSPDRFSRLLPVTNDSDVSLSGESLTVPKLAVAARLQEYKDLLGSGGNRFSDWLETFFASKIEHVDRPKLLFSASQTVNVQVVMNQGGQSNLGENPLGQQGGAIAFNTVLGRSQSYYFREPGYMIDMFYIRPVYYWSTVWPDYLNYRGADYFNPVYNDIGYQDVPGYRIFSRSLEAIGGDTFAREPIFNEFRSSYDEVLGQLNSVHGSTTSSAGNKPLYSYWVQQRNLQYYNPTTNSDYYPTMFVDLSSVNSPFASNSEDNFFINLSYSIRKKNLVNKTFATRLANR